MLSANHSENQVVAMLSQQLALECGYSPQMARCISIAAELHDVGKTRIDKRIVNKAGSLTSAEFEEMKLHTIHGFDILSRGHSVCAGAIEMGMGAMSISNEVRQMAALTALMHHERADGQGYWGIKGSSLPLFVSIVSICDVYCALITKRVYKEAWSPQEALAHINKLAGSQFCPALVCGFTKMIENV